MRAMVEPINQPPGFRARRQFARKACGVVVVGSMCSITSKRVTMSNCAGVSGVEVERTSSRVVFRYRNLPLRRCASTVGSMRPWSRAIWISVGEGSTAVIDAARVGVGDAAEGSSGIVRASDSAKMPPPQPISR